MLRHVIKIASFTPPMFKVNSISTKDPATVCAGKFLWLTSEPSRHGRRISDNIIISQWKRARPGYRGMTQKNVPGGFLGILSIVKPFQAYILCAWKWGVGDQVVKLGRC